DGAVSATVRPQCRAVSQRARQHADRSARCRPVPRQLLHARLRLWEASSVGVAALLQCETEGHAAVFGRPGQLQQPATASISGGLTTNIVVNLLRIYGLSRDAAL